MAFAAATPASRSKSDYGQAFRAFRGNPGIPPVDKSPSGRIFPRVRPLSTGQESVTRLKTRRPEFAELPNRDGPVDKTDAVAYAAPVWISFL